MSKMPEPENPYNYIPMSELGSEMDNRWMRKFAFDKGAAAQRELLEGYVKLPSAEEAAQFLGSVIFGDRIELASEILQWLQEER